MESQFTPIDTQGWPRAQIFYYFTQMAPTGYTVNVTVDVTEMQRALRDARMKFFPAYLYLITRVLNRQAEFRVAYSDGVLGCWDTLTPLYAAFHEDDKTISFLWTPYHEDFCVFHEHYLEDKRLYGDNHGILAKPGTPPPSCYTVSCIPWVRFDSFALHGVDLRQYFFPSVEAGKLTEGNGKIAMPLSLTLHHATTDGWHVHLFLEELQHLMNRPEDWLT
jgi:chloramphenicol O-acetyltransferase type A